MPRGVTLAKNYKNPPVKYYLLQSAPPSNISLFPLSLRRPSSYRRWASSPCRPRRASRRRAHTPCLPLRRAGPPGLRGGRICAGSERPWCGRGHGGEASSSFLPRALASSSTTLPLPASPSSTAPALWLGSAPAAHPSSLHTVRPAAEGRGLGEEQRHAAEEQGVCHRRRTLRRHGGHGRPPVSLSLPGAPGCGCLSSDAHLFISLALRAYARQRPPWPARAAASSLPAPAPVRRPRLRPLARRPHSFSLS
ncbi:hypothetical protein PVAP13_3NG279941 [Panicum virgatum]|uniref:Uncharacterized protein n=1 Tax=Panicum virgatum TaxID=38727 RepID=A0A8T0UN09_PANVG|nr:hypothetical protein PVAP13_3NG279941 [Panicum virgatum]